MEDETEEKPADFIEERDVLGQPIRQIKIDDKTKTSAKVNILNAVFAGFSERIIAAIIDQILCTIAVIIVNRWFFNEIPKDNSNFFDIAGAFFQTLYFAGFESSIWQATPGKKIMKIKVIGIDGCRISFMHGVGRYWAKTISILVLFMGVISIYKDKRRQGWHDMLANTFVVKDK